MRPRTIGLIVNPRSGGQTPAHNLGIARRLVDALQVESVITGPGTLGGDACPSARIVRLPPLSGRAASQALAQAALAAGIDALAVIGGDGTLSDVAWVVYRSGSRCPLLGIGAGSINAGDLITCQAAQVDALHGQAFRIENVHALEARFDDQALALAFNDVVIGTTIVGTLEGAHQDLDARAFMESRQVRGTPRPIGRETARVTRLRQGEESVVALGRSVGTVIVGFTHDDCFFGKAIIGGVGLSAVAGIAAGCLVCDQALVRIQLDPQELLTQEPVRSAYVSLPEDAAIRVTGLDDPAVLCADGNPLAAFRPADVAEIAVRLAAVRVLRLADHDAEPAPG